MNRTDIERLAREAGATPYTNRFVEGSAFAFAAPKLDAFVALVEDAYRNSLVNGIKTVAPDKSSLFTYERLIEFGAACAAAKQEECWRLAENFDTGTEAAQAIRSLGKP